MRAGYFGWVGVSESVWGIIMGGWGVGGNERGVSVLFDNAHLK